GYDAGGRESGGYPAGGDDPGPAPGRERRRGRRPSHARATKPGTARPAGGGSGQQPNGGPAGDDAALSPPPPLPPRPPPRAPRGAANGTKPTRAAGIARRTTTREMLTGEERDREPGHLTGRAGRSRRRGRRTGRVEAHRDARGEHPAAAAAGGTG